MVGSIANAEVTFEGALLLVSDFPYQDLLSIGLEIVSQSCLREWSRFPMAVHVFTFENKDGNIIMAEQFY